MRCGWPAGYSGHRAASSSPTSGSTRSSPRPPPSRSSTTTDGAWSPACPRAWATRIPPRPEPGCDPIPCAARSRAAPRPPAPLRPAGRIPGPGNPPGRRGNAALLPADSVTRRWRCLPRGLELLLEHAEPAAYHFLLQLLALAGLQERGHRGGPARERAGGLLVLGGGLPVRSLLLVRGRLRVRRTPGPGRGRGVRRLSRLLLRLGRSQPGRQDLPGALVVHPGAVPGP